MSSWNKAAKSNQKVHRERHQPESRKHLGLLQKKKDYKLRARDANRKKKTLKLLHRKALNKNPDEFHFHMINSRLNDGVHYEKEKEEDEHTKAQKELMETQDLKYIRMKRIIEKKKIERLQAQLHLIDDPNVQKNTHTFFDDDDDDDDEMNNKFDLLKPLKIKSKLLECHKNVKQSQDLEKEKQLPEMKKANALKTQSYQELKKRIEREKELSIVQQKLEMKIALQKPRLLKPKKIKKATKKQPAVYKFKYERKK